MIEKLCFRLPLLTAILISQIPLEVQAQEENELQKKLADYSKPAVVRIIAGCIANYRYGDFKGQVDNAGLGTGFFIDPNGYIVTNSHVIDPTKDGENACKEQLIKQIVSKFDKSKEESVRKDVDLLDFQYVHAVQVPTGDTFDYEIKENGTPIGGGGKDVAILKIDIKDAPSLEIINSNESRDVKQIDPVLVIGYPYLADLSLNGIFEDDDLGEATPSPGTISNTEKSLSGSQTPVLQLNASVSSGSSGSPVINNTGKVIGMITMESSDGTTTIPFAITSSTILEFIRSSGASLEKSNTDVYYREALDYYSKGNYQAAHEQLKKVNSLYKYHSDAQALESETFQRMSDEYNEKNYRFWIPLALGGATLLAAGYAFAKYREKESFASTGPMDSFVRLDEQPSILLEPRAASDKLAYVPPSSPSPTIMADQPYITLKDPQGRVAKFDLTQPRYTLGRGQNCDLRLPDDWQLVSKQHATLVLEGLDYRIYDGDGHTPSTNKLFTNGNVITPTQGHLLTNGDRLAIGKDSNNQIILTYSNPKAS